MSKYDDFIKEINSLMKEYTKRHGYSDTVILEDVRLGSCGFSGKISKYDYFENVYLFRFHSYDEFLEKIKK